MASQSKEAKMHRERQALQPYAVPACADFRMNGEMRRGFVYAERPDLLHAPECPNHPSSKIPLVKVIEASETRKKAGRVAMAISKIKKLFGKKAA